MVTVSVSLRLVASRSQVAAAAPDVTYVLKVERIKMVQRRKLERSVAIPFYAESKSRSQKKQKANLKVRNGLISHG